MTPGKPGFTDTYSLKAGFIRRRRPQRSATAAVALSPVINDRAIRDPIKIMLHQQRFTPDKIRHRLELIAPLVYGRQAELPPFRYLELPGPTAVPPISPHFDDTTWPALQPHSYWCRWGTDFILRTTFTIPAEWEAGTAVALYLPLGDAGEGDYGVSLLNDCKYGHDIQDQTPQGGLMRLSLLRGSTNPDPLADLGEHEFSYSLLPHHGRVGTDTIAQAYALNNPPFAFHRPDANDKPGGDREKKQRRMLYAQISSSLMSVDRPHVIIETVKQAEDGNGMIVRLYESQRQRGPATLQVGFPLQAAWRTNLLEENQEELVVEDDNVRLTVRPFQIITLRLLSA